MSHGKHYDDVRNAFDQGTVVDASRQELEQLLLAVGRARVLDPANQARAAEMGETMRQLLAARQSQEAHSQAMSVAKLALWVSLAALVASLVQAVEALNIIGPLKSPLVDLQSGAAAPSAQSAASGGK
ncbi:MAG: hypothetical protein V4669_18965 [Pseudomonadota bacterium]